MGFVLLGLMTLTQIGLSGAVLQMFSHGIIAGLLFAVVGRMIYDRTHTRELSELQPMNLQRAGAVCRGDLCAGGGCVHGLARLQRVYRRIAGAGRRLGVFPRLTIFAGVGILVGIAFMVRVWIKAFFAENDAEVRRHRRSNPFPFPNALGRILLLGTTILIGLWPGLLLDLITPALHSPLFQPLWKGGLP